jgi:uncharacterized metal-binding protein
LKPRKETNLKVVIVPCSGIGKAFGSVSREAAYIITEDLRPEYTDLVALAKLVMGEASAVAKVSGNPAITIDGCKLACASKMVEESGGKIAQAFDVLDVYRRYKDFRPEGIAVLNENGIRLAEALADEASIFIDNLATKSKEGRNA